MRLIKGPPAIIPVGDLEVTLGGFDEEVRDGNVESGSIAEQVAEAVLEENEEEALGARMHVSRVYMVITL